MTLKYEKAKELKEAGFPFKRNYGYSTEGDIDVVDNIDRLGRCAYCERPTYGVGYDETFILPTLSELIEACGDELVGINKMIAINTKGKDCLTGDWIAQGQNKKDCGNSPEEAVANLWLELNK